MAGCPGAADRDAGGVVREVRAVDRLTGAGVPDGLPVGRRVAYWRGVRRMSQQVFADRLGKSKSWVDKIERGVWRLD